MGTWEIFNVGDGRAMKWTAQLNKSGRSELHVIRIWAEMQCGTFIIYNE